jgi:DNA cross-link repair 1C protein
LQVHIDSYQSHFYGSLSIADDRTYVAEFSALNGFYVGNHYKPGCLTSESSSRIHSCEPGTPCHNDLLKAKKVVWITPVITRSREGVELPELGAGGGGGDLHQKSELELYDGTSISELENICKQTVEDPNDVRRLLSQIEVARSSKDHKMSLRGVDLGNEDEISLQDFVQRLCASDKVRQVTSSEHNPEKAHPLESPLTDVIHFPFSRHSSYTELCELVAAFKPRDIYPCTVEEQSWTEDLSMEALFGHLCSGTIFRHDEEMILLLQERQGNERPLKRRKTRRNIVGSQESGSGKIISQEYDTTTVFQMEITGQPAEVELAESEGTHTIEEEVATGHDEPIPPYLAEIKAAFESQIANAANSQSSSSSSDGNIEECEGTNPSHIDQRSNTQMSISQSALISQAQEDYYNAGLQLDGVSDAKSSQTAKPGVPYASLQPSDLHSRHPYREQAYMAAKLTLQTSDSGAWDDLGIRSVGNHGHCEAEEEL